MRKDSAFPPSALRLSPSIPHALASLLLLVALLLSACKTETRVVRDGWSDRFKGLPFERGNPDAGKGDQQTVWAIELDRFVGPDRVQKAQQLADEARRAGVGEVYVRETDALTTVSTGRVSDPKSPDSQALLRRVRDAVIAGTTPFAAAEFRPLTGAAAAAAPVSYDPLDLKQFPGMFTLQVGYYDAAFGANFRDAAVAAARALRDANQEAYFYHGPNRSMVTIGLFDRQAALVPIPNPMSPNTFIDAYSPLIKELQKQYPHNIGNAPTFTDPASAQIVGDNKSSLIQVPQ